MLRALLSLVVAALLIAVAPGCGGGDKRVAPVTIGDPLAEALAHAPADAPVLAVVSTVSGEGPSAGLARAISGAIAGIGGLGAAGSSAATPGRGPLDTRQVVVWSPSVDLRPRFTARIVADQEALEQQLETRQDAGALAEAGAEGDYALFERRSGAALARRGPVLVTGPDLAALKAVLRRRAAGQGQWTRALLGERTLGLPSDAVARVLIDARAFADERGGRARTLPFVAAARRAAVVLVPEVGALRARARISTAPLTVEQLPLAPGPAPPEVRGNAPLVAAVREPRRTLAFLRAVVDGLDPDRLAVLRDAEGLLGRFAGVDLQQDLLDRLTGSATVTTRDARSFTLRADLEDPGDAQAVLDRLGTIARLGGPLAGLVGVDLGGYALDEQDGIYRLDRDGELVVRLAVLDGALIASTDPRADLRAAAAAPAEPAVPAEGALRARVTREFLRVGLPARFGQGPLPADALEAFGEATVLGRSAPDGLELQLVLPVRRG